MDEKTIKETLAGIEAAIRAVPDLSPKYRCILCKKAKPYAVRQISYSDESKRWQVTNYGVGPDDGWVHMVEHNTKVYKYWAYCPDCRLKLPAYSQGE